jgi:multicomponent Na+:H+ antiporter subunit B
MTSRSLILQTSAAFLLILLVVYSLFVLLRGHDEPGGGFIGGLLAAAGFALFALAFDPAAARRLLAVDPRMILGTGLLIAAASGIRALLVAEPFMEAWWMPGEVPGLGKLSTVLLFDVGVYLTVLGTALQILLTLSEE